MTRRSFLAAMLATALPFPVAAAMVQPTTLYGHPVWIKHFGRPQT